MPTPLAEPAEEQRQRGYFHTWREISQQPSTWLDTGERMIAQADKLRSWFAGVQSLVLTGSGSSEYAGHCVAPLLQRELSVNTTVVAGGTQLTFGTQALPVGRPGLMVSLARSGDSPESVGALSLMLETEPDLRHLVLTCNAEGGLARAHRHDPRVHVIALDDRTNDRSLVMTSSFTNLALAARFLGLVNAPDRYLRLCQQLADIGACLLSQSFDSLARVGGSGFRRAVFLGNGTRLGAARECALKMLEMTGGRVSTMCESYLGLRHGPMSFIHPDTLVVCFLSSDPLLRAYESDLLQELNRKQLGMAKLIIGERIPGDLVRPSDTVIEVPGQGDLGDENAAVLNVVAGQVLALFCCLREGLQPDSPSTDGVINRVVERFTLHRLNG